MSADYLIVITGLEVHYVVFEVPLFFESSERYLSRTIILNTH
jgi:dephospho-CoA kinase